MRVLCPDIEISKSCSCAFLGMHGGGGGGGGERVSF